MRGICFHLWLYFLVSFFNFLVEGKDLFASDCSGMFRDSDTNFQDQTNINYEKFLPSVVKITSYGSQRISREEIQDRSLDSYIRLPSLNKTDLSFWGQPLSKEHNTAFERTLESIGLGGPWLRCAGIVVSHNTLITTAHCIMGKAFTYYQAGGKTFYSPIKYYSTASGEDKLRYDVGVLIFPDHTFDNIRPLQIATKDTDYRSLGFIGIKAMGEDRIQKEVTVTRQQDLFIFSEKEVSHLDEGSTWLYGPLVNPKGQLLGMSVGRAKDDKGENWLVCTDFTSEPIQALFKKLVEEKRAIISGIE